MSSYKDDKDYQTISEITNSIVSSEEFAEEDIKDILPNIIAKNKDTGNLIL